MKTLFFCLLLAGIQFLPAQTDNILSWVPPTRSRPYFVPKLEVIGPVNLAVTTIAGRSHRDHFFWPAWQMITFEIGIKPRGAIIAGIGGRYGRTHSWTGEDDPDFWVAELAGAKLLVGYRRYLTKSAAIAQGFYIQPTGKLYVQRNRLVRRNSSSIETDHDYIVSLRIGWQKRLIKRLHLDVAVGPGIGIRGDYRSNGYTWAYYWDTGVSEIDHIDGRIFSFSNRAWTSLYLIGDASLALGWKF